MEIEKVLVLNLSHMDPETAKELDELAPSEWPFNGGTYGDQGYFLRAMHVEEDPDLAIPDDLWLCMQLAVTRGCTYIVLDPAGPQNADLPTYPR